MDKELKQFKLSLFPLVFPYFEKKLRIMIILEVLSFLDPKIN